MEVLSPPNMEERYSFANKPILDFASLYVGYLLIKYIEDHPRVKYFAQVENLSVIRLNPGKKIIKIDRFVPCFKNIINNFGFINLIDPTFGLRLNDYTQSLLRGGISQDEVYFIEDNFIDHLLELSPRKEVQGKLFLPPQLPLSPEWAKVELPYYLDHDRTNRSFVQFPIFKFIDTYRNFTLQLPLVQTKEAFQIIEFAAREPVIFSGYNIPAKSQEERYKALGIFLPGHQIN